MPALKLIKSDFMDDWYLIERAEHDGREWFENDEYGASFMRSARLGIADIEGPFAEMLGIAKAIKARSTASFRRCEASYDSDKNCFFFMSPRNSEEPYPVSVEHADDLADQIVALDKKRGRS